MTAATIQSPPWETSEADIGEFDGPAIIVYRPHGKLNIETMFQGPYADFDAAYEAFADLPAIGPNFSGRNPGVKYIAPLKAPK